jgi:hypothetical protein
MLKLAVMVGGPVRLGGLMEGAVVVVERQEGGERSTSSIP